MNATTITMNGLDNVPHCKRLPFNRQRQPSTDSDTSSEVDNRSMEGPGANEYKFIENSHSNKILEGLNELRKSGQFCDVNLSVSGQIFPAHRNVLASFSPYFSEAASSSSSVTWTRPTASASTVFAEQHACADLQTKAKSYALQNFLESLLSAANLLQVLPVKEAACQFLERHMDSSNCLGIHCFAEQHACADLQTKAKSYALQNFLEVCQHEEFLQLLPMKLIELTSNDNLVAEKEEAVFLAVARWLNHKHEERKLDFHKVLETVRLPLLSVYFLHDCVESMPAVKQNPSCCQLVEEAKLYHLLPDRRQMFSSSRTKQRNNADTIEVIVAVGGEDDKVVLRSVECYCTKTNTWKPIACLPFAVSKHGLVASGKNTLYLAGGEFPDGSASQSVWRYDPILDYWQEMASMLVPRSELGTVNNTNHL
ncbi:kelch-like protein 3 [Nilaparvata lugens]|uniref:kelch-like protein 3 n=1 Tax=Nilaparvata lugens TaxID=108931 RepID=UPI00193E0797|nr:kelch-like protein 3 [Nilaparvata lugens]